MLSSAPASPARRQTPARPQAAQVTDPLSTLRREAARMAGMPVNVARRFGETAMVQAGPVTLGLSSLLPDGQGPLLLSAAVDRPAGVDEAAWTATLLVLNAHGTTNIPGSFGLDRQGRSVLLLRLAPDESEPPLLAAAIEGAVGVWMSLLADAPQGSPVTEGKPAARSRP